MESKMTQILREKVKLFIHDYYQSFNDNEVVIGKNGLSWEYCEFEVRKENGQAYLEDILAIGGVDINLITHEVRMWCDDYGLNFTMEIIFETWNDYIIYMMKSYPKELNHLMHWDDYFITVSVSIGDDNQITDVSIK